MINTAVRNEVIRNRYLVTEKSYALHTCYLYNAKRAQIVCEDKLKASRQGVALTPEEMNELDNLVSPLLLQGQSIKAVLLNHKDRMKCRVLNVHCITMLTVVI